MNYTIDNVLSIYKGKRCNGKYYTTVASRNIIVTKEYYMYEKCIVNDKKVAKLLAELLRHPAVDIQNKLITANDYHFLIFANML